MGLVYPPHWQVVRNGQVQPCQAAQRQGHMSVEDISGIRTPPSHLSTSQTTITSCPGLCNPLLTGLPALHPGCFPSASLLGARGIWQPKSEHTPPLRRALRGAHLIWSRNQRPHGGPQRPNPATTTPLSPHLFPLSSLTQPQPPAAALPETTQA